MRLREFVDLFEEKLTFSRAHQDQAGFRQDILAESERVHFGHLDDEVRNVAFVVQPNKTLCEKALDKQIDTIVSHHRWCHRASGAPKLGALDNVLKENGVKMLSYHLCWDICDDGIADMIMRQVFQLSAWKASPLKYKGREIPGLARWTDANLSFSQVNRMLTDNYIRTERFLGHLDRFFDRLIVIPGGGLVNEILSSILTYIPSDSSANTLVLSSGSGMATREHYLEFFYDHETEFSILDANHYDLEAVGVSRRASALNSELASVECNMWYADHYINYAI